MHMKKLALASTSMVLMLTACSGGSAGPGSAGEGQRDLEELAATTAPATGELDSVTWNLPFGEPASLDPIKAFNYPENTVVANLCEGLMVMEPDYTITPSLAESVENIDGKTYVYTLRDDVTFWNGNPMTAEDVAFSLRRHLDAEEGSYWASDAVSGNVE